MQCTISIEVGVLVEDLNHIFNTVYAGSVIDITTYMNFGEKRIISSNYSCY